MHRTLKDDTTRPPAATCRAQQVRLHHWRKESNEARPHESLDQQPPATLYRPSPRPGHFEVRRVSRNGGIRWASHRVPVSHSMLEEYLGFEPVDDGLWDVYSYHCRPGRFNERLGRILDDRGRAFRHTPRV